MITIEVTNSLCQIQGHSKTLHAQLAEMLRFMDPAVEFSYRSVLYRIRRINDALSARSLNKDNSELNKELAHTLHVCRGLEAKLWKSLYDSEGFFPSGLLPRVLDVLDRAALAFEVKDLRKKPEPEFKFVLKESLPALRPYQKSAVRELLEHHRGVVVMPTGTGKTKTACRMIELLGVTTLVITPSKAIVDLMMTELVNFFGKGKVQKLTTKNHKLKAINVINIQALVNLKPEYFKDIKAVIIDEFHHAAADTYLIANEDHLKNCYYRIGLTATNFRNDGADLALEAVLNNVLFEYPIKQAIADGYLMRPEFKVIPTVLDQESNYQKAYRNQIVDNEHRNDRIRAIAEVHRKNSVLILVKQIEHGEALQKLLPGYEFVQGETKDHERERALEDFRKGKLKGLIGTTVIGEGVDLPIANVLIMAGGGKAKSQIMQNIGRVLRIKEGKPTPIVYDFTDEDGSWLEEHSIERSEVYKLY